MVFNLGKVDYAHRKYYGNELEELSKGVGYLSPFPDPRAGGKVMALVVLVSEHVGTGNNVL